jgi:hypothetical protein
LAVKTRFFVFIFAKNRFYRQHPKPYLNELCVLRAQKTLADIDYQTLADIDYQTLADIDYRIYVLWFLDHKLF